MLQHSQCMCEYVCVHVCKCYAKNISLLESAYRWCDISWPMTELPQLLLPAQTAILYSSGGLSGNVEKEREVEVKSNPFSKQQKGQC